MNRARAANMIEPDCASALSPPRRAHGGAVEPGVLDFSANLNPLGPPDSLAAVLTPENVLRYPEPGSLALCRALAERHDVDAESVLVTNGACEAIELVMASLAPRRVVVLAPAFTEYEDAARAWGHEVVTFCAREEDEFHWQLARLDLHPHDLLVLGNPSSPAGVLTELPDTAATLLVDETYLDFVEHPASAIGRPRTLVVRSFTKLFACPGLRLGYLVGGVAAPRARQPAWSVSRLAQAAGLAMLAENEYQAFTRRFVCERREELTSQLQSIPGIKVFPSSANFLLLRVSGAAHVARRLLERAIAVRLCDGFTGLEPDSFLRVAVRKRSENQRFVETLTETLHAAR
ncbi:MAG TPA: aminotransferase class I/II-fold pyridoxal phosphate-dependent enzyme [Pirellulales bacterium]|jgi:threonine-phosphate decarboxylase|nr:aminotransferase class I/II-fold pyridoxal phosphate-dependent enzyme [Pirellulales bacterium]